MEYFIMIIIGGGLIIFGGIALLAVISSGLGIPFLVFPLAWFLMWQHNKKLKAKEQYAKEHPEPAPRLPEYYYQQSSEEWLSAPVRWAIAGLIVTVAVVVHFWR